VFRAPDNAGPARRAKAITRRRRDATPARSLAMSPAFRTICAGPLLFLLVSARPPQALVQPALAPPGIAQRPNLAIAELDKFLSDLRKGFAEGSLNSGYPEAGFAALPRPTPFYANPSDPISYIRASDCLTAAIYYEAANQSDDGQRAVAQVVLNRVHSPAWPNSVCGVVFQGSERSTGCQFTFTCDGSLARIPSRSGWARAHRIAADALHGRVFEPVGNATNYHTIWIRPYWAPTLVNLVTIGAHTFYRPRLAGDPPLQPYSARETISFQTMAERVRAGGPNHLLAEGATPQAIGAGSPGAGPIAAARVAVSAPPRTSAAPRALALEKPEPAAPALASAAAIAAPTTAGIRPL